MSDITVYSINGQYTKDMLLIPLPQYFSGNGHLPLMIYPTNRACTKHIC